MNTLTKWKPFKTQIEPWAPLPHWSPIEEMDKVLNDLDRFLSARRSLLPSGAETMALSQWLPAVDIIETEQEFIVKAELPEVKKEDVKVTVEGDFLLISGERKAEKEEKGKKYHRVERLYGSFDRSFMLPEGTEPGKIRSEFRGGLLTVHLPKNPHAKTKAIEIKVQ